MPNGNEKRVFFLHEDNWTQIKEIAASEQQTVHRYIEKLVEKHINDFPELVVQAAAYKKKVVDQANRRKERQAQKKVEQVRRKYRPHFQPYET